MVECNNKNSSNINYERERRESYHVVTVGQELEHGRVF